MTQPLDPYTLRQAAARWPIETLSSRSAQSFLRSLAEDAEQHQPATVDPLRSELWELVNATGPSFPWISADALAAVLDEHR